MCKFSKNKSLSSEAAFSGVPQKQMDEALKLLDGVSRLSLSKDNPRSKEVRRIYGKADCRKNSTKWS